jgi:hypothetical protein
MALRLRELQTDCGFTDRPAARGELVAGHGHAGKQWLR